jgi:hypothetical protein
MSSTTNNSTTNRDASPSYNGYIYQRFYTIYLLLCNIFDYILEEGYEDIDQITDKTRIITQLKYQKNGERESLTTDSGLLKVIKWYIDNPDKLEEITLIEYVVFNEESQTYCPGLVKLFHNKEFEIIGKYCLILLHNQIVDKTNKTNQIVDKKNTIKLDIRYDKNKISSIFNDNIDKLQHTDKLKYYFDKLTDSSFVNSYFSKFKLLEGDSFDKLKQNIVDKINKKYSDFIKSSTTSTKQQIKAEALLYHIFDKLTIKMFTNDINQDERQLNLDEINADINTFIEQFQNTDDLTNELLIQSSKYIKAEGVIPPNIIKTISNYDNSMIAEFLLVLLNRAYTNNQNPLEIDNTDIVLIKEYLIRLLYPFIKNQPLHISSNVIKQLNRIRSYKTIRVNRVTTKNIMPILDKDYKIQNYNI